MVKAVIVKEVAVRVLDRVGELAKILTPIAESRLSLKAINTISLANEAQVRLIAEEPAKVLGILKSSGYAPWEQEVLAVEITNEPGAVAEVTSKLAADAIDIRTLFASTGSGADTTLYLWTSDNTKAIRTLS